MRSLIEHGPSGEKFTDTVGVLTSWDNGVLRITRKSGERVRVAESALVAGKVVPGAPARRRGPAASYEELARVAARGWRPVESERLGGWELRAAAGFTRRANSVLPLGDPGLPLDDALTAVRRWYAARGLPAYVQTATGAEGTQELLCAELEQRGWVREVTAELWTGGLAPVARRRRHAPALPEPGAGFAPGPPRRRRTGAPWHRAGRVPSAPARLTATPCPVRSGPPPCGCGRRVSGWPWRGSCGPCPGRGGGWWRGPRWWSRRRRRGGPRVRGR
ncbi:hypothetical protein STENM223S_07551 [Streptomyces tendae]